MTGTPNERELEEIQAAKDPKEKAEFDVNLGDPAAAKSIREAKKLADDRTLSDLAKSPAASDILNGVKLDGPKDDPLKDAKKARLDAEVAAADKGGLSAEQKKHLRSCNIGARFCRSTESGDDSAEVLQVAAVDRAQFRKLRMQSLPDNKVVAVPAVKADSDASLLTAAFPQAEDPDGKAKAVGGGFSPRARFASLSVAPELAASEVVPAPKPEPKPEAEKHEPGYQSSRTLSEWESRGWNQVSNIWTSAKSMLGLGDSTAAAPTDNSGQGVLAARVRRREEMQDWRQKEMIEAHDYAFVERFSPEQKEKWLNEHPNLKDDYDRYKRMTDAGYFGQVDQMNAEQKRIWKNSATDAQLAAYEKYKDAVKNGDLSVFDRLDKDFRFVYNNLTEKQLTQLQQYYDTRKAVDLARKTGDFEDLARMPGNRSLDLFLKTASQEDRKAYAKAVVDIQLNGHAQSRSWFDKASDEQRKAFFDEFRNRTEAEKDSWWARVADPNASKDNPWSPAQKAYLDDKVARDNGAQDGPLDKNASRLKPLAPLEPMDAKERLNLGDYSRIQQAYEKLSPKEREDVLARVTADPNLSPEDRKMLESLQAGDKIAAMELAFLKESGAPGQDLKAISAGYSMYRNNENTGYMNYIDKMDGAQLKVWLANASVTERQAYERYMDAKSAGDYSFVNKENYDLFVATASIEDKIAYVDFRNKLKAGDFSFLEKLHGDNRLNIYSPSRFSDASYERYKDYLLRKAAGDYSFVTRQNPEAQKKWYESATDAQRIAFESYKEKLQSGNYSFVENYLSSLKNPDGSALSADQLALSRENWIKQNAGVTGLEDGSKVDVEKSYRTYLQEIEPLQKQLDTYRQLDRMAPAERQAWLNSHPSEKESYKSWQIKMAVGDFSFIDHLPEKDKKSLLDKYASSDDPAIKAEAAAYRAFVERTAAGDYSHVYLMDKEAYEKWKAHASPQEKEKYRDFVDMINSGDLSFVDRYSKETRDDWFARLKSLDAGRKTGDGLDEFRKNVGLYRNDLEQGYQIFKDRMAAGDMSMIDHLSNRNWTRFATNSSPEQWAAYTRYRQDIKDNNFGFVDRLRDKASNGSSAALDAWLTLASTADKATYAAYRGRIEGTIKINTEGVTLEQIDSQIRAPFKNPELGKFGLPEKQAEPPRQSSPLEQVPAGRGAADTQAGEPVVVKAPDTGAKGESASVPAQEAPKRSNKEIYDSYDQRMSKLPYTDRAAREEIWKALTVEEKKAIADYLVEDSSSGEAYSRFVSRLGNFRNVEAANFMRDLQQQNPAIRKLQNEAIEDARGGLGPGRRWGGWTAEQGQGKWQAPAPDTGTKQPVPQSDPKQSSQPKPAEHPSEGGPVVDKGGQVIQVPGTAGTHVESTAPPKGLAHRAAETVDLGLPASGKWNNRPRQEGGQGGSETGPVVIPGQTLPGTNNKTVPVLDGPPDNSLVLNEKRRDAGTIVLPAETRRSNNDAELTPVKIVPAPVNSNQTGTAPVVTNPGGTVNTGGQGLPPVLKVETPAAGQQLPNLPGKLDPVPRQGQQQQQPIEAGTNNNNHTSGQPSPRPDLVPNRVESEKIYPRQLEEAREAARRDEIARRSYESSEPQRQVPVEAPKEQRTQLPPAAAEQNRPLPQATTAQSTLEKTQGEKAPAGQQPGEKPAEKSVGTPDKQVAASGSETQTPDKGKDKVVVADARTGQADPADKAAKPSEVLLVGGVSVTVNKGQSEGTILAAKPGEAAVQRARDASALDGAMSLPGKLPLDSANPGGKTEASKDAGKELASLRPGIADGAIAKAGDGILGKQVLDASAMKTVDGKTADGVLGRGADIVQARITDQSVRGTDLPGAKLAEGKLVEGKVVDARAVDIAGVKGGIPDFAGKSGSEPAGKTIALPGNSELSGKGDSQGPVRIVGDGSIKAAESGLIIRDGKPVDRALSPGESAGSKFGSDKSGSDKTGTDKPGFVAGTTGGVGAQSGKGDFSVRSEKMSDPGPDPQSSKPSGRDGASGLSGLSGGLGTGPLGQKNSQNDPASPAGGTSSGPVAMQPIKLPNVQITGQDPNASTDPKAAGANASTDPKAAGANASTDPKAAGANASTDPKAAGANASTDPKAAGANASTDPKAAGANASTDPKAAGANASTDPKAAEQKTQDRRDMPAGEVKKEDAAGTRREAWSDNPEHRVNDHTFDRRPELGQAADRPAGLERPDSEPPHRPDRQLPSDGSAQGRTEDLSQAKSREQGQSELAPGPQSPDANPNNGTARNPGASPAESPERQSEEARHGADTANRGTEREPNGEPLSAPPAGQPGSPLPGVPWTDRSQFTETSQSQSGTGLPPLANQPGAGNSDPFEGPSNQHDWVKTGFESDARVPSPDSTYIPEARVHSSPFAPMEASPPRPESPVQAESSSHLGPEPVPSRSVDAPNSAPVRPSESPLPQAPEPAAAPAPIDYVAQDLEVIRRLESEQTKQETSPAQIDHRDVIEQKAQISDSVLSHFTEDSAGKLVAGAMEQAAGAVLHAMEPGRDNALEADAVQVIAEIVTGRPAGQVGLTSIADEMNTADSLEHLGERISMELGIAGGASANPGELVEQIAEAVFQPAQVTGSLEPVVLDPALSHGFDSMSPSEQKDSEDRDRALEEREKYEARLREEEAKRYAAAMLAALKARQAQEEANRIKAQKDLLEIETRQKYVIVSGDTLESIAQKKLFNRRLAGLIFEINKSRIPCTVNGGKRILQLRPRMEILLPTRMEIKRYQTRLFGRGAENFEYDRSCEERDTMKSGAQGSKQPNPQKEIRKSNVEAYLGNLRDEPTDGRIKYACRLGDTLRSIAMRHPALKDVALWKLLAELNGLSTQVDRKGHPTEEPARGSTLVLPLPQEIAEFRERQKPQVIPPRLQGLVGKQCAYCHRLSEPEALVCTGCARPFETSGVDELRSAGSVAEPPSRQTAAEVDNDLPVVDDTDDSQYTTHSRIFLGARDYLARGKQRPMPAPPPSPSSAPESESQPPSPSNSSDPSPGQAASLRRTGTETGERRNGQRNQIRQISDECRIVCFGTEEGYRARLEYKQNEFWLPVVLYEVNEDCSQRHEYNLSGARRSMTIKLPPAQSRQMANNDLNKNWEKYIRNFLKGV